MDILDELEAMAMAMQSIHDTDEGPEEATIERWTRLFGYSASDAKLKIEAHRANLEKKIIPDLLWAATQASAEAEGHDKESYEFMLTLSNKNVQMPSPRVAPKASSMYLFKLSGPLGEIEQLASALNIAAEKLSVFKGTDENGDSVSFCEIDGIQRDQIETFTSKHHPSFLPTFISNPKARKLLSNTSIYPTLGRDATIPHNRPSTSSGIFHPAQDEYPVWYFFYGTLADTEVLTRLLGTHSDYVTASVRGGKLKTWGGKYFALVDDCDAAVVHGSAFLVESKEQEDTLRHYETDKYEVVRCRIEMPDETVDGLTFRFIGEAD